MSLYIPKGYDEFDEDKNQAVPSLFDISTGRYMTINAVWQMLDSEILIKDMVFVIKKKTNNNNDMHQE